MASNKKPNPHMNSNFVLRVWILILLPYTSVLSIPLITAILWRVEKYPLKKALLTASIIAFLAFVATLIISFIGYLIVRAVENAKIKKGD